MLKIEMISVDKTRVEATMPIIEEILQPFGFVHGGATISLLESAASEGTAAHADWETQRPFGVDIHVAHRKGAKGKQLRGVAELEKEELSRSGAIKHFWKVTAYDDEGDIVSEGSVFAMIVPLARLEEKANK